MIKINDLTLLDIINILSFVIQVENNEELHEQSSNDDVLKMLHNDIIIAIDENEKLCKKIMKQNEKIIELLTKGG